MTVRTPDAQPDAVADLVRALRNGGLRVSGHMVSGPRWRLKALLTVVALAYLMSFPSIDVIRESWSYDATWKALEQQFAHPFVVGNYLPNTHESKLALRLTPPVILHALGLKHGGALALQALSGIALLWLALEVAFRATGDRVLALLTTAGLATTFPGIAAFCSDYRGMFDGLAYALVLAAMWAPAPWIAFASVFLAGFTDERALLSSALVLIWWWLPASAGTTARRRSLSMAAVVLAWVAYLGTRMWLTHAFGLSTPSGEGTGASFQMMYKQLNGFPFGVWTALETLWIPVLAAVAALAAARRWGPAAAIALSVAAILIAASAVSDFTRSAAYVFPVLFVSLKILHAHEPRERIEAMVLAASALAIVIPTYYTGLSEIRWFFPAPFQILRMALS